MMKKDLLSTLDEQAAKMQPTWKNYFKQLKKKELRDLDDRVHDLHHDVFDEVDCLACANCCRTLGPRITSRDIDALASALRIRPHQVIDTYLRIDEDNDYVFRSMPCPFLGADNYCAVYSSRPKACREYPHTDRKKFVQLLALTCRNAHTCPAVYELLCRLAVK